MEEDKKFSFGEGLILVLFTLFSDGAEALAAAIGLIPVLTPLFIGLSWFINVAVMAVVMFVFFLKGERGLWYLAGSALEFIPFVNVLPLRTATCLVAIYLANHPKVAAVAGKSAGAIGGRKIKTPAASAEASQ